jgi:23S rRNA (cytidine1920-2'-O)/16S rRNA (cytidine1409-2'-O)-methyltransferase
VSIYQEKNSFSLKTGGLMKRRLDQSLVERGLVASRSQAESYIKLGVVKVDGNLITQSSKMISPEQKLTINVDQQYVSRAALKLDSVISKFKIDFKGKNLLDVGSSTGGFTDYALKHGANRVIAVDVGTNQLHASLRTDNRIELHEQTDIRNLSKLSSSVDIVMIDVSFISLRQILPSVFKLTGKGAEIITLFKPQFETTGDLKNKGVIKNDRIRRDLIKQFETWLVSSGIFIVNKADSSIVGSKGNHERFYLLKEQAYTLKS